MVSAWVDVDLARRLEQAAAAADRSKSATLRMALRHSAARHVRKCFRRRAETSNSPWNTRSLSSRTSTVTLLPGRMRSLGGVKVAKLRTSVTSRCA
jgi:hypothetical protein